MAAAGSRTTELARALGGRHDVAVAAPEGSSQPGGIDRFEVYDAARPASLRPLLRWADVVFALPLAPRLMVRELHHVAWIVDLLNPEPFEGLEFHKHRPRLERKALERLRIDRIAWAARVGTAFVCGSERQRDMWLGFLAASRRLDTDLYERDPEMRLLIDVVPSGVPVEPPQPPPEPVLRGPVFPEDARIVMWNGGLWDWLDPLTLLEALALLRREDPRWVLAVSGMERPSDRPRMRTSDLVEQRVDELGLRNAVHLPDSFTPYARRAEPLLEADVAVSAHVPTLEARFSYRNRFLECLWAGLPIVCTEGDRFAEEVASRGWGETVPPQDPQALATAMRGVVGLGRAHFASALRAGARDYSWDAAGLKVEAIAERALAMGPRRQGLDAVGMRMRHGLASRVRQA